MCLGAFHLRSTLAYALTQVVSVLFSARPKPKDESSLLNRTPYKEIYYSSRAILPLIICLVGIVLFILKKPLPTISFYLKEEEIHPARLQSSGGSTTASFDKRRLSVRKSIEYARQFAFISKSTRSGTLSIWGRYLRGATSLATAGAEGRMVRLSSFPRLKMHAASIVPVAPTFVLPARRPTDGMLKLVSSSCSPRRGEEMKMTGLLSVARRRSMCSRRHPGLKLKTQMPSRSWRWPSAAS